LHQHHKSNKMMRINTRRSLLNRPLKRENSILLLFISISMVFFFSCNAPQAENKSRKVPESVKQQTGIHKTFKRGPVTVDLELDKQEISIADRLNLTLTITSDEEYDVDLPGFGEKLEQFGIVDYHTSQPALTGDKQLKISRSYVLEPFLSGEYAIPPMSVSFRKKGDTEDKLHEIQTEEITVTVTSLLPENFKELTLHDIKPPENLPQSYALLLWFGGGFLLLITAGIVLLVFVYKRKQTGEEAGILKILAHQQAFDELQALITEDLVGKGQIKAFYQKISKILRRYIENRFFIRAPEQTTEEFLIGMQARKDFDEAHKTLLKNFLIFCDLVKFARHEPVADDIQNTFDACKAFIMETQVKE